MADNISPAAEHYGQAFCNPGDQDCIRRVAEGFERDVDQAFGVLSSQPPQVVQFGVFARGGQKAGTLTYADGTVTVCYTRAGGGPDRCGVVGNGIDGLIAAQNMLGLQGFSVRQS